MNAMNIGSFGELVFEVSSMFVRTFDEFMNKKESRWAVHEVVGGRTLPEFVGQGQGEITMTIHFRSELFVSPRAEIEKLEYMVDEGIVAMLIIGGKPLGNGFWYLESVESEVTTVDKNGSWQNAIVNLTLKEY